jgi:hypothetical protein
VLCLLGCVAVPLTAAGLQNQVDRDGCVWPALRTELEALARALPDGAKVAAPWDSTEDYMYFAPQARYLNVLDPLFMRSAHPDAYRAQSELFSGQRNDVPLALQASLDSDFLAFPARTHPALLEQLADDPRLQLIVPTGQVLYRVLPDRARAFVREFRMAPTRLQLLQPAAAIYLRHPLPAARAIEGMIDGSRLPSSLLSAAPCIWFAADIESEHASAANYEFASTAPARLWLGDRVEAAISPSEHLLLGRGASVHLPSLRELAIEICPKHAAAPSFYLLRRD